MPKKTSIKFPKKIVNHYIASLQKKIKVDGVLLFGSFAWGKPTKHSDIDLVIISPDFVKKKFDNRLDFLTQARDEKACQVAMDVIGYTPKEFAQAEKFSAILTQAKNKGRWIYPLEMNNK
ncbi:nucleotidyltransferase domain-containing protein [Patescibacteria group bacterium]|nr:nucleotidyltransferase domain-containing protein [Patescibacteria group bacterium]MBU4512136.1 nucleotidyltransferase domain-containing protein [Patescibacteria group bacterium]MCG2692507.1 nucleotidyltransferase domain-containing protein [Candidatus Parcubacteria bacterium]